jgi:hypothetical protein
MPVQAARVAGHCVHRAGALARAYLARRRVGAADGGGGVTAAGAVYAAAATGPERGGDRGGTLSPGSRGGPPLKRTPPK